MSDKHTPKPNRQRSGRGNESLRLSAREAEIARALVTEMDIALGNMYGPASRSVPHDTYHPNPAVTSGSMVVAEATANYSEPSVSPNGSHDDLRMTEAQRSAEVDQLNAAYQAPAEVAPQAYGPADLDLEAIRARVAAEAN